MVTLSKYTLTEQIKRISVKAVESMRMLDIVFGKVTDLQKSGNKIQKINIELNEALSIDEDFLIQTETAVNNLEIGDKVVLIQLTGGQEYLFLDRVVSDIDTPN